MVVLVLDKQFTKTPNKRIEIGHLSLTHYIRRLAWFWLSGESQNKLFDDCTLQSGCSESRFEDISSVSFLLSPTFLFFSTLALLPVVTVSSVHQVHILSEALSWALNCCFYLPADQCSCCNLAMKDLTRQRVLRVSWWHTQVSAAGCCVIEYRLNSYTVMPLGIPSISFIRAAICRRIFYIIESADSFIDRYIDVDWFFYTECLLIIFRYFYASECYVWVSQVGHDKYI